MMNSSVFVPNTFSFFLFFLCFSSIIATEVTSFETLTLTSLKFLGDAHVFNNSVRLTQDLLVPNSRAGVVLYNKPIRFMRSGNPTPISFTTYFSFTIVNLNPGSIGGGLAFVISLNDEAIGDADGYLGIPNGAVAIEFDTNMDVEFKDINANHVGLDLNSTFSIQVANLSSINVDLKSGKLVNALVEYSGATQQLNISISHDKPKPESPLLSISINLNKYVNEFMFVGFAGSTQGSTEIHSVKRWSFISYFDDEPAPSPINETFNSSPLSTMTPNSNKPKTKKKNKGCKSCGWMFGIVSIVVIAAFGISLKIGTININCINTCCS